MAIMSDKWIRKNAEEHNMIKPFINKKTSKGVLSYGLSSYGYDARLDNKFKIYSSHSGAIIDPKDFPSTCFIEHEGEECIIPPNSFVLAKTIEYFQIPNNIMVLCVGKSTYARCGIIVNVTPLEPGWKGYVTLEFANAAPLPARIYANEGACQFIFIRGETPCDVPYNATNGKYMNQVDITLPKIEVE